MNLRELLRSGRLQYVTLWALAAVCFGLAVADASVLGLDQAMLTILAGVFAATTAEYRDGSRCSPG